MVAKCELKLLKYCTVDMLTINNTQKIKLWIFGGLIALLLTLFFDVSNWPYVLLVLAIMALILAHIRCKYGV